ncbi:hypothetical protein [Roseovarius salis]
MAKTSKPTADQDKPKPGATTKSGTTSPRVVSAQVFNDFAAI